MALTIADMATFCKRKGFVYPDAEIYGGMAGFWDYGPLGVELKGNIKKEWWKTFVQQREDVFGIDGAIITSAKVWQASGHADCFTDILVECKKCHARIRGDSLVADLLNIAAEGLSATDIDKLIKDNSIDCPNCHGDFENAKQFNLMFRTNIGPIESTNSLAYLRPETAQLIFTNFKLVQENSRAKLPFGIAQMGKAFRNEISPRDFLFRSREFEQMEIEFFTHPDKTDECIFFSEVQDMKVNVLTADAQKKGGQHKETTIKELAENKLANKWHAYWLALFYKWFTGLGIKKENLRLREHKEEELAHYAGACFDIEYNFPFGWKEIHGNADRKQFDLKQHMKFSKKDLGVFDEAAKQKVIPAVASEPSQGVDRALLAFMFDAYEYDKKRENIVLKLHPKLAPVKAGIFPLIKKEGLDKKAKEILNDLNREFSCFYDESGSIGRRYARQDENGTPYCITVDFDSLKNYDVTLRNRDDTKQIRVKIKDLKETLRKLVNSELEFEYAGHSIK